MATYKYRVKVITEPDVERLEFEPVGDGPLVVGLCRRDPSRFGRIMDGVVLEIDPAKHEATFGVASGAKEVAILEKP